MNTIDVPEQLTLRACADLQAREANDGDWPNGVPDSFQEIRNLKNIDNDHLSWVIMVENVVKREAVRILSLAHFVANENHDNHKVERNHD